ncbi:MAG TPA: slipin family protein [Phycisphaerae bacterium]|nr:slipin family protein [Phycisphaerae bacterium]
MLNSILIRDHERGLRFRDGNFVRLLGPGRYRTWRPLRDRIEVHSTLQSRFNHELLDVLVQNAELRAALTVVELSDHQRALLWKDDRLAEILGPGRHAFWRTPYELTVEIFDVDAFGLEHPRVESILAHPAAPRFLQGIDVDAHEEGLLFRDGRLVRRVPHGRYVYWKGAGRVTFKAIDLREQQLDVAGQEIMTRDKVTLRVNLLVAYRVVDTTLAVTAVSDHAQTLYREAQLALRAAVGTRLLDALLADKEAVGGEVLQALTRRAGEFGVEVRSVGLRDIILPGEMKSILNRVIEAEKEAQANLIRRREETAAARSQANTAKLLAENPTLARMKELETLAEILAGAKTTFVLGAGDLTGQVRSLVGDAVTAKE